MQSGEAVTAGCGVRSGASAGKSVPGRGNSMCRSPARALGKYRQRVPGKQERTGREVRGHLVGVMGLRKTPVTLVTPRVMES